MKRYGPFLVEILSLSCAGAKNCHLAKVHEMESGRLRVGLVGAGVISKRLGSSFNSCEHTRVTAVCDINQSAAVALASQYKGKMPPPPPHASTSANVMGLSAAVVQDYEALCESPDVDLVYHHPLI